MEQQLQAVTGECAADGVWFSPAFADASRLSSISTCAPARPELRVTEHPQPSSVGIDPRELEQYRGRLTQFATRLLRNQAEAEDAVQETLLAALQSEARFSGRSSLKTWLFGILKHKIADVFRLRSREQPLDIDYDLGVLDHPAALFTAHGEWRTSPSHWADPEAALTQSRFLEVLEECIDSLPKNAAQVFTMRDVLGMDTREICQAVGITENNCHVILHRTRLTLRSLLERLWFQQDLPPLH